jgi:hypothetical protein
MQHFAQRCSNGGIPFEGHCSKMYWVQDAFAESCRFLALFQYGSLQTLRGVVHQAEIGEFVNIEARFDEAEIAGHVDVALQRGEIGHHVGISIIVPYW